MPLQQNCRYRKQGLPDALNDSLKIYVYGGVSSCSKLRRSVAEPEIVHSFSFSNPTTRPHSSSSGFAVRLFFRFFFFGTSENHSQCISELILSFSMRSSPILIALVYARANASSLGLTIGQSHLLGRSVRQKR